MTNTRHIPAVLAASALALAGTIGTSASAAPQNPNDGIAQMSSALTLPSVALPAQAYELADQLNVELPSFIWQSDAKLEGALQSATENHLELQGHNKNDKAYAFAREWAGQAARGEVEFHGRAGDGNTRLETGTGNIYRLNRSSAKHRLAWLQRDIPVQKSPAPKGYGVATSTDGRYIYVAEYFLD